MANVEKDDVLFMTMVMKTSLYYPNSLILHEAKETCVSELTFQLAVRA
jgi:hypothetical protein